MFDPQRDGDAWLAELAVFLERSDLSRATADAAARHFRIATVTLLHRLRRLGISYRDLKTAERIRRLRDAIDDAPSSTPQFLAELCGYRKMQSFEQLFIETVGCRFNEWRGQNGLPPLAMYTH